MNVLSIGNSFSQDAQRYLHRIAKADGYDMNTFNLYIGGCPLSAHYRHMLSDERAYTLEMNGASTGFKVSIKEALLNRSWDVVTVQQASHMSTDYETYQPYLVKLVEYIKLCAPKAKIAIHQTWAYAQGSPRLYETMGYKHHTEMYGALKKAYQKAFDDTKADFLIPSGKLFQELLANEIPTVHRDTFHATLGLGRYALGLLWYAVLTGNDIKENSFRDFDEAISKDELETAKKCVAEICGFKRYTGVEFL